MHNNQRDGLHRQAIARGRVNYEPNSLAGGCPFQAGMRGFVSFPQPVREDKVRGKPEKFAEHYNQARLFFRSQSPVEQQHIIGAFRFELTKVQTHAVRERIVSMLANVDDKLAQGVADGLGIAVPKPMPKALERDVKPEVEVSPALSLLARPGDGTVRARRVALLVADGVDGASLRAVHAALAKAEAVPRFVGAGSAWCGRRAASRSTSRSRSRPRRPCCGTRWCCPTARLRSRRWPRSATRSSS